MAISSSISDTLAATYRKKPLLGSITTVIIPCYYFSSISRDFNIPNVTFHGNIVLHFKCTCYKFIATLTFPNILAQNLNFLCVPTVVPYHVYFFICINCSVPFHEYKYDIQYIEDKKCSICTSTSHANILFKN